MLEDFVFAAGSTEFVIPPYFDYVATFTWALSGAIVGARRGYDIVGVFVIALVSSTGGGLIRDGFLLQRTPGFLTDGTYLILIFLSTLIIGVVARRLIMLPKWVSPDKLIELIDSVGVPAFAIVGMELATAAGVALPGVVFIGVVNGVGGGLLRDIIAADKPLLLEPGQFVTLVLLLACIVFISLTRWYGMPTTPSALATIVLFFLVRAVTIRFNWRTEALLRERPGPAAASSAAQKSTAGTGADSGKS